MIQLHLCTYVHFYVFVVHRKKLLTKKIGNLKLYLIVFLVIPFQLELFTF